MLFVSFDAEEDGMIGSREFVRAKVHDTANCAAMFVFDCFGGNFLPWETRTVYALGSEYSQALWDRVQKLADAQREIDLQRHAVFIIEAWDARADYKAYRLERVPFVFLTTATPWHYHTEHDDPDVINYPKLEAATRYAARLIRETADDAARPVFIPKPQVDYAAHARSLKASAERGRTEFRLDDKQRASLEIAVADLESVVNGTAENPEVKIKLALGRMFGIISVQRPK
jgi:Zn-dependent M28 family amino/carboxypeptidase